MKILTFGAVAASIITLAINAGAQETKIYTRDELIVKALENSPRMDVARYRLEAGKGGLQQAKAYDNPEMVVEAENFAGTGAYKGYSSGETGYSISQRLIRPDKYSARVRSAEYDVKALSVEADITRREIIKNVRVAYANASAAEENRKIAADRKELAEKMLRDISRRVDAAASPLYQKSKAEIWMATSGMELLKAEKELDEARTALAGLWGKPEDRIELDSTELLNAVEIDVSEQALLDELELMPDAAFFSAAEAGAKAGYELEKANSLQDPTIGFGIRDMRESNDQALLASFSLPIPVFDMNRGNVMKAQNELAVKKHENRERKAEIKAQTLNAFRRMQMAYQNISELKHKLIPTAEKAFKQTKLGYDRGKFPYLEVLDAQRTLFDARYSLNEALREYHIKQAEVERFLPEATN